MLYYQFELHDRTEGVQNKEVLKKEAERFRLLSCEWNERHAGLAEYYIASRLRYRIICFGAVSAGSAEHLEELTAEFLQTLELDCTIVRRAELTMDQFLDLLETAQEHDCIESSRLVRKHLGLDFLSDYGEGPVSERLLGGGMTLAKANQTVSGSLFHTSMESELRRIFTQKTAPAAVHPVHYFLVAEDPGQRAALRDVLLESLYAAGRLKSRRVCCLPGEGAPARRHPRGEERINLKTAEQVYACQQGGTVVLRPTARLERHDRFSSNSDLDNIPQLARIVREHQRDVLTVVEVSPREQEILTALKKELPGLCFVMLKEDLAWGTNAAAYLRKRAEADGITGYAELLEQAADNQRGMTYAELDRRYEAWHSNYLRTRVFPQYGRIAEEEAPETSGAKGDAYRTLCAMPGLQEARDLIDRILSCHRMEALLEREGIPFQMPALHLVFSGSPGTAKTTTARLFAQILKDNEILPCGRLIEAGRADLVDRYVGGTAPRVKALFEEARGSVLFIDEAYSLLEDRRGSYGDEAINAIVQELENTRADTAVIFAGYSDRMQEFLRANPGLRSRISFQVDFPDYTPDELTAILKGLAADAQLRLTAEALEQAEKIFARAARQPEFGNGRFVRNLFEQARLRQARRLLEVPSARPGRTELLTLTAGDFVLPTAYEKTKPVRRIGFASA